MNLAVLKKGSDIHLGFRRPKSMSWSRSGTSSWSSAATRAWSRSSSCSGPGLRSWSQARSGWKLESRSQK